MGGRILSCVFISPPLALVAAFSLSGCAYGGYGDLGVSASGTAITAATARDTMIRYAGGYSPYGYSTAMVRLRYGYGSPYGWYDGYYYPGTGYYVYDQLPPAVASGAKASATIGSRTHQRSRTRSVAREERHRRAAIGRASTGRRQVSTDAPTAPSARQIAGPQVARRSPRPKYARSSSKDDERRPPGDRD